MSCTFIGWQSAALLPDLAVLPEGDDTQIGSKGRSISR